MVAGASSELVYTLQSDAVVSLTTGQQTRFRYALSDDGSVQTIVENAAGFEMPSALVEQYWYRPEGPALTTEPLPARGHVVLRE